MRILVIGGTGPTGLLIVRGLVGGGHRVTILHRGWHERPETPAVVDHLHADPYDEGSLSAALEGASWDVVVAMHGRLPAPAGTEEMVLTDPFDYPREDASSHRGSRPGRRW